MKPRGLSVPTLTVSVACFAACQCPDWSTREHFEGSRSILLEILFRHFPEGTEEEHEWQQCSSRRPGRDRSEKLPSVTARRTCSVLIVVMKISVVW
jgi:hypothetical protein